MTNLNTEIKVTKVLEEKNVTVAENLALWSPAETSKRFVLLGFVVASSAAGIITLLDEATTIWQSLVAAGISLHYPFPDMGYQSIKAGNKLKLKVSVEGKVTGTWYGYEE